MSPNSFFHMPAERPTLTIEFDDWHELAWAGTFYYYNHSFPLHYYIFFAWFSTEKQARKSWCYRAYKKRKREASEERIRQENKRRGVEING